MQTWQIVLIAIIVLAGLGIGLYFAFRKKDDSKIPSQTPGSSGTPGREGEGMNERPGESAGGRPGIAGLPGRTGGNTPLPSFSNRVTNGVWISPDRQLVVSITGDGGYVETTNFKSTFTFVSPDPTWKESSTLLSDTVQFPNDQGGRREFLFYFRQDELGVNLRGYDERLTRLGQNLPIPTPYVGPWTPKTFVAETPKPTKPWLGAWRTVMLGGTFFDLFLNDNGTGSMQNKARSYTYFNYSVESNNDTEAVLKATDAKIRFPLFITYNKAQGNIMLKQQSYTGNTHESGPFYRPRTEPEYYGKWISASPGGTGEWANVPPPIQLFQSRTGSMGTIGFTFAQISEDDKTVTLEATRMKDNTKFRMTYTKALDLLEVLGANVDTQYVHSM